MAAGATYVLRNKLGGRALSGIFFGLILGSVIPDSDLIVSSLSFLVTFDTATGKLIHRTLTHSLVFIMPVILVGAVGMAIRIRDYGGDKKKGGDEVRGDERGEYIFPFILGLGIALALHTFLDLFYLVGVKLFFPISLDEFFIGPFRKEILSTPVNNVINGIDFMSDTIIYMLVFYLCGIYGGMRKAKWFIPIIVVLNLVIFIPLTLIYHGRASYDDFLVILYIPGIFYIALSTLVIPFMFRRTFEAYANRNKENVDAAG